jgi:hypothetical protein
MLLLEFQERNVPPEREGNFPVLVEFTKSNFQNAQTKRIIL